MNNNLKVLKHFVENKDKTFTIKKVSELLKTNYRIAHEEITKLEKDGLILITKQGNAKVCQFNYRYSSKVVELEEIRKQELFKNQDLHLIYKRLSEVKNPFYCLVLFGSYSSKTNKKGSDIDLCLIAEDEIVKREVKSILKITPINVDLQEFSSQEFLQMLKSKENNVGNEIVKNNVILYGLEQFYKLVNNVKQ